MSSLSEVVTASASRAIVIGLIPNRVKPITLKLVFTASLLDAHQQGDSEEKKSASLLVVPLGKAHDGIPPPWSGRQMAGNS